jgi:hypothetical protein
MKKPTKREILEFLAELASPIDPEVFAGFGSKFQNQRYEWEQQNQEMEEEYICAWIDQQEVTHTLDILLEIAHSPPGGDFYHTFRYIVVNLPTHSLTGYFSSSRLLKTSD